MVPITGAWSNADAGVGLEMAAKNPLCMAIDADKIIVSFKEDRRKLIASMAVLTARL
jgi:hypothetical protein